MKHIFIIGSKGIPAKYGGFETFVDKLTGGQVRNDIKYHVACLSDNDNEFEYNGAHCFNVKVPAIMIWRHLSTVTVILKKIIYRMQLFMYLHAE